MGRDGRTAGRSDGRTGPRFPFLSFCPTVRLSVWLLLPICPSAHLLAQCPDGSPPPCGSATTRPAPARNSVAVLSFENLSGDSTDTYLAEGLTDEVITRLGQVTRLAVKARAAVRRMADSADPLRAGRALGVAHVVTGSIRRAGPRLRVTVELARVSDGERLWGNSYDRTDGDLLAIETDIAQEVAMAITGRLLPAERASLTRAPTESREAYDHFLRGNYFLARRNPRALARAVLEFEAARRLDPRFLAAVARIAYCYGQAFDRGWSIGGMPPESLFARGLAAAEQTLRQDSAVSDAWLALGQLRVFQTPRAYGGVLQALERAIAIDSTNPEAWHQYGTRLLDVGRDQEARAALHRALALEPDRAISLILLSMADVLARRLAPALQWADSALMIDAGFTHGYEHRAHIELLQHNLAAASASATTARALAGEEVAYAIQARVDAERGDTAAVRTAWTRWKGTMATQGGVAEERSLWLLAALVAVGEWDEAFRGLGQVPRSLRVWRWLQMPDFDPVRNDPRFQRLVEEAGG